MLIKRIKISDNSAQPSISKMAELLIKEVEDESGDRRQDKKETNGQSGSKPGVKGHGVFR